MEKLLPVDVSTLQERVYLRIREAISQGDFAHGEVLTIRTLAKSLGTSAMPVREALQRLVAEKVLVQQSNRSVAVTPFTPAGFGELIRIRLAVESLAARTATLRADLSLVDQLHEFNTQMANAIHHGDAEKVLDANRSLHFTIYAAAEMPQLLEIISGLWLRTGPYLGSAFRNFSGADKHFLLGTQMHDRAIRAIAARDANRAGRAVALDIWFTARRFRTQIEQMCDTAQEFAVEEETETN